MIKIQINEFLRVSIEKNEQDVKKSIAEEKQKRAVKIMEESGMKKKFKKRTFDNFIPTKETQQAYTKAKDFAENFKDEEKGLLLSGTVGSGKTHLAAAIANYLINNLYTVIYGNVTDIISRIYDTYNRDSELRTKDILEYITNVDLLIIDDLGKESESKNINSLLYQIINTLYEDEKLITVTTNLTGIELSKKIGQATVSRLTEMTTPIIIQSSDWRLKR